MQKILFIFHQINLYLIYAKTKELSREIYNINEGRNAEMVKRSEALKGYSFFIYLIREYGKTMKLDAAAEQAVKDCIRQNVLKEFLEENATEILNMLYGWDDDEALEVYKEEAHEDGLAEGRKKGLAEGMEKGLAEGLAEGIAIGEAKGMEKGIEKVFALLEKGVPLAEAKRQLSEQ
jgi:flagellar biosynthesis/type III secretory pathway protein FliH